ncbi:MAG: 5-(carboxyamino)imidazole ribonucleotide synthase [Pseudomonadota bacterium]
MTPLAPGETIGILGGGQLGRLLSLAAARLGFDVHIYCPAADTPAARVSAASTVAAYEDEAALARFANACSVVTYEFENVPVSAVETVEAAGCPVRPGAKALDVSQDRLNEKTFLRSIGIGTVDFVAVEGPEALAPALEAIGGAGILKTRREGYDGKGQVRLFPDGRGLADAEALAAKSPCILEAFAPFEREVSVIIARTPAALLAYDPAENTHEQGILVRSQVPAGISTAVTKAVFAAGRRLADALDYVGVFGLEVFVLPGGEVLANEMAPRVHNSGHWTADACVTGQFEQHIRAVAGWALGSAQRHYDVDMRNALGAAIADMPHIDDPFVRQTLYGKRESRKGRKMAHFTRLTPLGSAAQTLER